MRVDAPIDDRRQPFVFDLATANVKGPGWPVRRMEGPDEVSRLQSYTIITTNELIARVHVRMSIILQPGDFDR
jgi:putative SOS response-associated peptidase YedK